MTSAYSGEIGNGTTSLERIKHLLPIQTKLKNGWSIEISPFQEKEWDEGMNLMNFIIREGKSWPFEEEFKDLDSYRRYFLSHDAFVVRRRSSTSNENAKDDDEKDKNDQKVAPNGLLGCFYIKPNYPGRCSHICNGGFITAPNCRRLGIAKLMGKAFLKLSKEIGYKSSYFNLVFESNKQSVALWEGLGFVRVSILDNAAKLVDVPGLDTAYGYWYNLETLPDFAIVNDNFETNPLKRAISNTEEDGKRDAKIPKLSQNNDDNNDLNNENDDNDNKNNNDNPSNAKPTLPPSLSTTYINNEGNEYIELSSKSNRRCTVKKYKKIPLIDIREFYNKSDGDNSDGDNILPSKKGISLNLEQYKFLRNGILDGTIDGLLKNIGADV